MLRVTCHAKRCIEHVGSFFAFSHTGHIISNSTNTFVFRRHLIVVVATCDGTILIATDHIAHIGVSIHLAYRQTLLNLLGITHCICLLADNTTHIMNTCHATGIHTIQGCSLAFTNNTTNPLVAFHITYIDTILDCTVAVRIV